jgi:hypothetical protein
MAHQNALKRAATSHNDLNGLPFVTDNGCSSVSRHECTMVKRPRTPSGPSRLRFYAFTLCMTQVTTTNRRLGHRHMQHSKRCSGHVSPGPLIRHGLEDARQHVAWQAADASAGHSVACAAAVRRRALGTLVADWECWLVLTLCSVHKRAPPVLKLLDALARTALLCCALVTSVESCKSFCQKVLKELFRLALLSTPHAHDFLVSILRQFSAFASSFHKV